MKTNLALGSSVRFYRPWVVVFAMAETNAQPQVVQAQVVQVRMLVPCLPENMCAKTG